MAIWVSGRLLSAAIHAAAHPPVRHMLALASISTQLPSNRRRRRAAGRLTGEQTGQATHISTNSGTTIYAHANEHVGEGDGTKEAKKKQGSFPQPARINREAGMDIAVRANPESKTAVPTSQTEIEESCD